MHIAELRIRNFRSIEDLIVPLDRLTTFCGPNSCGKSNLFRAIQLAFQGSVSVEDAQNNLTDSKLGQGGPKLSIWVECRLADAPAGIQSLAGVTHPSINYSFRLTRSGTATRKLGDKILSADEFRQFLQHFIPVYVPPIRDLSADGLIPFKRLIREALQRARGAGNIKNLADTARQILEKKATILLEKQNELARRILKADRLSLDTSQVDLEALYENIGLRVRINGRDKPLSALGTGHQSAVIMHLYRQLGEDMPGEVLYLFEEPDNHLHPSTIRSICDDLKAISQQSQVLVSTHSPVFLAHVGFSPLRPLAQNKNGFTTRRKISLLDHYSEKQARAYLESYGLKLTEPLLASRVIVLEGVTDRVVLATLFEKRMGMTPDQADLLLIAAGGKERAGMLCHLLHCLGVDWRCVLDRDAAFSSEVPYSKLNLSVSAIQAGVSAVDTLRELIDESTKRGGNATKSLLAIRNELATDRPAPKHFEGSPLKTLLEKTGVLTGTEQAELKNALTFNRKRECWKLFGKARTFVWSSILEEVLLHNAESENCVERALLSCGELTSPLLRDPNRHVVLLNKLHDTGNKPDVLSQMVTALEDGGHFSRTEVNECFGILFNHLR
jgi:predicted ATPase